MKFSAYLVFRRDVILCLLCLVAGLASFAKPLHANEVVRPSIWVKPEDRQDIIRKVNSNKWAASLYQQLGRRAAAVARDDLAERGETLKKLPFIWANGNNKPPTLPLFRIEGGGTREQSTAVADTLKDGVDCGVMYFLTEEEKYAKCGADILFTVINALKQLKVHKEGKQNSSWMFPGDHLYEARVIGAQLPVIYDFVYNYLKAGGQVYDVASKNLVPFNFEDAQNTFETYIWLALNKGLLDSNWPVLESSSLVHNILALDDPEAIKQHLPFYTHVDTKRQASLKRIAQMFKNDGDIWPESFGYSIHVANFSVYLMTLLDRYNADLQLGKTYPNISAAFKSYYDLQYPNGEYPFLGDGHRTYETQYHSMEKAYLLAKINGNREQENFFGNYLVASMSSGKYDRAKLKPRSGYPSPYYTPTQLLWFDAELSATASVDVDRPRPRTKRLEFAGMNIQRNISESDPIKNSLMSFIAGGSYIHGHASGMDMELYGQGYVLGVVGGKGTYRTDMHENYYRLFAAHNTVISNGASASKGGWINLGIEGVRSVLTEPALGTEGVSENYSVTRSAFTDAHNLVAPAEHERTLALVRLSDSKGYYLDIFKAKSDYEKQFHDYIYRNVGDTIKVSSSEHKQVKLKQDSKRYQDSASMPWTLQRAYRHPGWHFLEKVRSSDILEQDYQVVFEASKLGEKGVAMKAFIPDGFATQLTTAQSPKAYGAPKRYAEKTVPTMVLRREGDAWNTPFVVAYESISEGEDYAVQAVDYLLEGAAFKGVKVSAKVDDKLITQLVISQDSDDDIYQDESLGIYFQGRFAIVTLDSKQQLVDMYIASGSRLTMGEQSLQTTEPSGSAYQQY